MALSKDLLIALYPVLDQALDLSPAERTEWLDRLRVEQPAVVPGLEALLDQENELEARRFLEGEEWLELVDSSPSPAGLLVGAYTLERPLGHGGMGSVWLAHRSDGQYEGLVAVKLLNLSLLDPVGRERFRREGTLVARLAHPGIARLIDAGVTGAGQPYLVLEYVEGLAIDQYCDRHRLPPERRLALFFQVLAAVDHAHAHLIVHRDLKPSNILVTADGSVKLLDFGIAKLLESDSATAERSLLTDLGGLALTPEFAAPEQASGGPVTTATDVYALGVLLYVLLAGQHPTGQQCRTAAEHIRAVLDTEPPRLSAAVDRNGPLSAAELARVAEARATAVERLPRLYRGDLDNILLKALKKQPVERYASVTAFSDDLGRYLKHQPVSARPDSLSYRTAKFLRRNRAAMTAATITAAGLIGATIFSAAQMHEARRQRDAAVHHSRRADAQIEFQSLLMSQVGDRPITMREILDQARRTLEQQYAGDPRFLGPILLEMSERYSELGDAKVRGALLARAESLVLAGQGEEHLAEIRCHVADNLRSQGRYDEARSTFQAADSMLRMSPDPRAEVKCLEARAFFANEMGNGEQSEADIRRAIAIKDSLGETGSAAYLELQGTLGAALHGLGRPREAVAVYDRVMSGLDSSGRGTLMVRAVMQHEKALSLLELGETAEAERQFHEAVTRAARSDPAGRVHSQPLIHYAETALTQGHADSALKYFGQLFAQGIEDTSRYWQGRAAFGLARTQAQLHRLADARRTTETFRRLSADFPRLQSTDDQVPDTRILEGWLALAGGDTAGAHTAFLAALRSNGYFEGKRKNRLRPVAILVAETALSLGRPDSALRFAREAREIATVDSLTETRSARVGEAWLIEGRALVARGDTVKGRTAIARALTALRNGAGPEHPTTREAEALAAEFES